MKYSKYQIVKLAVIVIMAALGIWAGISGNFYYLIPAAVIMFLVLFTLRKRVKETVVDERVNLVAGRASRLAMVCFTFLAVITGTTMVSLAENSSDKLFSIGLTLDYSACALLLCYWLSYAWYNRKFGGKD